MHVRQRKIAQKALLPHDVRDQVIQLLFGLLKALHIFFCVQIPFFHALGHKIDVLKHRQQIQVAQVIAR